MTELADVCPVCVRALVDGRCPTCGKRPTMTVHVDHGEPRK